MLIKKKLKVKLVKTFITSSEARNSKERGHENTKRYPGYLFCAGVSNNSQYSTDCLYDSQKIRFVFMRRNGMPAVRAVDNIKDILIDDLRRIGIRLDVNFEGIIDKDLVSLHDLGEKGELYHAYNKNLLLRMSALFHFLYPCIKYDGYNYPAEPPENVKKGCNFDVFWKLTRLEQPVPVSRINPLITYVTNGGFYVVYGGIVAAKSISQKQYNQVLNILKDMKEFYNRPIEEIEQFLENSFLVSDEVWNFYTKEEKWRLLLPASDSVASLPERDLRPRGDIISAYYHSKREKLYYLCSWFTKSTKTIFEFDYQTNEFIKLIDYEHIISYPIEKRHNCALDIEQDTLLIPTYKMGKNLILVFCLVSHRFVEIELIDYPITTAMIDCTHFLFWNFALINQHLVFTKADGNFQYTAYVDWYNVKRKMLNPKLEKIRNKFLKANLVSTVGKLTFRDKF